VNFKFVPDIAYIQGGHDKHHLDLYIPTRKEDQLLNVVVHIHGGGWQRGDRSMANSLAMCKAYASGGYLAVAPSYRLGHYPHHIEDVAKALQWVYNNIKTYGGNPTRIYLSGHSAGGNIAALFGVNAPILIPDLPSNFIRGVILLSGVYSLYHPMGGGYSGTKNFLFVRRYVRPVFGKDETILINNSPSCLLQLRLGIPIVGKKKRWSIFGKSTSVPSENKRTSITSHPLPPIIILSAGKDWGLEMDAQNFYTLLQQAGVNVKYSIVPNTKHGTICKALKTEELALFFIREHLD